jgi:hypothetical protein
MRAGLAHIASVLGDYARSAEVLATLDLDASVAHQDQLPTLAMAGMAATLLGDRPRLARIVELFEPFHHHVIFNGTACFGSVRHYVALAEVAHGRFERADQLFAGAVEVHEQLSAPALIALTRMEWARFLLRRGAPSDGVRARLMLEDALTSSHSLGLRWIERESDRLLVT